MRRIRLVVELAGPCECIVLRPVCSVRVRGCCAVAADERWWAGDLAEVFWLEITDRDDLGVDLNAPTIGEHGREYWSYSFVREVAEQDIVLHYRARPHKAITHWSRAAGDPYQDEVYWGAHGMASGRGPLDPYWRPGWRRPLDGPYALPEPVTLDQLRAVEPQVRAIHDELRDAHPDTPLYFPFLLSKSRPLRAFQGYLTKFPAALVLAIEQLAEVAELAASSQPTPSEPAPGAAKPTLGTDYRRANPDARSARRQPFSVDPEPR